jgi:hypothetical protein
MNIFFAKIIMKICLQKQLYNIRGFFNLDSKNIFSLNEKFIYIYTAWFSI